LSGEKWNKHTSLKTELTTSARKAGIEMTKDELISILEMITHYSYEYLKSLSLEELQKIYKDKR
jgi:hypothetical protein